MMLLVLAKILACALMLHLGISTAIYNPTLHGTIGNQTWFQSNLHSTTPILYIRLEFAIIFHAPECCASYIHGEKRCCPLLVLSSYNLREEGRCFSDTTLKERDVFLRSGVFFLDPWSQEKQDEINCQKLR